MSKNKKPKTTIQKGKLTYTKYFSSGKNIRQDVKIARYDDRIIILEAIMSKNFSSTLLDRSLNSLKVNQELCKTIHSSWMYFNF